MADLPVVLKFRKYSKVMLILISIILNLVGKELVAQENNKLEKIIILPKIQGKHASYLAPDEQKDLVNQIESYLNKCKCIILTRDDKDIAVILKQANLGMQGLTEDSGKVLFSKVDAFISIEIDETNQPVLSKTLKLKKIYLTTEAQPGFSTFDKNKMIDGIKNAMKDLVDCEEPPIKINPILKSMVMPGWGQYSKERNGSGISFFAGTILLSALLYSAEQDYKAKYQDYKFQSGASIFAPSIELATMGYMESRQHYASYQSAANNVNNLSYILVALYVWNLGDIIFKDSSMSFVKNQKREGFNIYASQNIQRQSGNNLNHSENIFSVSYFWRF